VVLPVDLVAYRRDGWRLDNATAEIAYVTAREGVALQSYGDREVVVFGRFREPQYGDPYQPVGTVTTSIEEVNTADRGTLAGEVVIDGFRFASQAERVVAVHGKPYPVVFGAPGASGRPATPAYPVDSTGGATVTTRVLVAGHHVQNQTIRITDSSDATTIASTANAVDRLGHPYAYVEIDTTDPIDELSPSYWIAWQGLGDTLPDLIGPGGITGAGSLAVWALSRSTVPIDFSAWTGIAPYLNRFTVDGFINDTISAYEFVTKQLGEFLPIALTGGSGGLRPVLTDPPEVAGAIPVTTSARFTRITPWTFQGKDTDVENQITVSFARNGPQNEPTASTVYGAGAEGETMTAAYSRELYGIRPAQVEVPITDSSRTATLVAESILSRRAILPEAATYRADLGFGFLRCGDWLALTDSDLDVEDLIVQIIGRRYVGARWEFDVLRQDVPQRDAGRVE
jgi:hypothetical protein